MIVATYAPTIFESPTGIMWWDEADGAVRSHFVSGAQDDEALAREATAGVLSEPMWENWAQRLADRTPHNEDWSTADLAENYSPQAYLTLARRRAA